MRHLALLLASLTALAALSDTPQPRMNLADLPTVKRMATLLPWPEDAIQTALADAERINPFHRPYIRYLYLDAGDNGKQAILRLKAATLAINTVSRSPARLRLVPVGPLLARVSLKMYAPRDEDLREWLKLWEELQYDPCFSQLVTHDADPSVEVVARYNSPAVPSLYRLQEMLSTQAPIVHVLYFQFRILSSFKGAEKLYDTVFGGRYYEFAGIKKSKKEGVTDEDLFFEDLGLQAPVARLFDRLRSDQRAVMKRSLVTGKPRRVDMFHTPSGRETTGWGSITHDLRTEDIDLGTDPVANLLSAKDKAREAIFDKPNGMHVYALFDGEGKLLDFADANNVVTDRTVPIPHVALLQSCISCMACHESSGDDGWKPITNDVKTFLRSQFDVFDDLSVKRREHGYGNQDAIDRIAGLYAGDFSNNLRQAKNDYARMVLLTAGPWPGSKDQTDVVKVAMSFLVEETRGYWFESVTPRQALRELGVDCGDADPGQLFKEAIPPDLRQDFHGLLLEDSRIGFLKEGLSINRFEFSFIYANVAERIIPFRNKMRAVQRGWKREDGGIK